MATTRLTVLVVPLDGWGHINACLGLAQQLLARGHRVVFAVDAAFAGKLKAFGLDEELLTNEQPDHEQGNKWFKYVHNVSAAMESPDPIDIAIADSASRQQMVDDVRRNDHQYQAIVQKVNPDVIVVDHYVCSPSIIYSGKPWVWLFSAAPLRLYNCDDLPPDRSGFSINDTDREAWNRFRETVRDAYRPSYVEHNQYLVANGWPALPLDQWHPYSPHLNVYLSIKELDYSDYASLPKTFLRVENFMRMTDDKFEIPSSLRDKPGKLLFLSMGSFGCANLKLMVRVTTILAKSKHRFIVAKGPLADKFELADNMWGQQFLPQTAVLSVVDAVVSHGGNNTVTEAFYYGKPTLVMPLFGDQYDNGQRLVDTGLGLRLNPFHCTEEELLSAVDQLVSDQEMINKVSAIGERIRKSDDKERVAKLIEDIGRHN